MLFKSTNPARGLRKNSPPGVHENGENKAYCNHSEHEFHWKTLHDRPTEPRLLQFSRASSSSTAFGGRLEQLDPGAVRDAKTLPLGQEKDELTCTHMLPHGESVSILLDFFGTRCTILKPLSNTTGRIQALADPGLSGDPTSLQRSLAARTWGAKRSLTGGFLAELLRCSETRSPKRFDPENCKQIERSLVSEFGTGSLNHDN